MILSEIKDTGKELKVGVLKRMLASALPIGSEIAIAVNGEILSSSKLDMPVSEEWTIGPGLGIEVFELGDDSDSPSADGSKPAAERIQITEQAIVDPTFRTTG